MKLLFENKRYIVSIFLTILITFCAQNLAYGNEAPNFTDGDSTTRSIAENIAADTNIGTAVAATDADNDTLTYSLGGTDAGAFRIVSTSGQLQTNAALDYETKSSYSVTVSASDGNGGSDSISVSITVTDVSEKPVFALADVTLTIAENTASGRNIGNPITATDPDSGDTLTYSLRRGDKDAFSIDPNTGQVRTKAALDYERKNAYTDLAVRATDSTGLTGATRLTINVTDVHENRAPSFAEGINTTRTVAENTPSGQNIGSAIAATDANNDTLTYSLRGKYAAAFSIVSTTGQLQTKAPLDYETQSSYAVTVTVSDGNKGSDIIIVTINVTDAPENRAPVFTDGSRTTRTIAENTASGQSIGTAVAATDADNDTLTYSLRGTDASSFSIVSTSGQLQTNAALDYETKTSYSVTVSVSDGNGGRDSITITINVTDVDENRAPVFADGDSTTRSIAENTAAGENIGSAVAATDADTGDTLTYSLGGTDAASFSIVSTTGQLRTSAALDYETKSSYAVSVSVSDGNGGSDSIPVTINVTDVNENRAPLFTDGDSTTRSIAENTASGENIGSAVAATDADTGDTLTYSLGGTDAASFSIVSTTGQLRTSAALDYETKSSYAVSVSVSDGNGGSDSIPVTINVTDVNENSAPVFTDGDSTTRSIAENTASGENIGSAVAATDADTGDTLTYSLGGTDASSFRIVSTSGQLQTSAALDYETKSSYAVSVSVSDGNGGSDSITVTINVTDVSEKPVFAPGGVTLTIAENAASGTNIGNPITATDPDSGDTLTYSLRRDDKDAFSIDPNTGQVRTKAPLDYEMQNAYTDLAVRATDSAGLTGATRVTINVTDVDENRAPVFTDGDSTTRSIAENTAAGENIGTAVAATDADTDDTLTYTLSGTDANSFSIVSTTGQLQTNAALDYETKASYSVTVSVADGNGESDSITVTINVTDVNENRDPVFTDGDSTTRSIAENTAAGENIGTAVAATDADNDTLTYTLGGTDAAAFSIVSTSGQLQTNASLDYETKSSYAVSVSVSDGNGGSDSITVTINVSDVIDVDVIETAVTPLLSERTPAVRDAIIAAVPDVNNANDVTSAHLAAITELNLEDRGLTSLKTGDFNGLTALTKLYLNNNDLTSLPSGVFDELTALTWLGLYQNQLTSLPSGVFDELTALTWLYLYQNQLTSLPSGVFDELTALTTLLLYQNELASLPSGVFDELTALTWLHLWNNELTSLPSGVFDELTALTKLILGANELTSLESGVFDELTALTELDLGANELTSLESGVFDELTALTWLNLGPNELTSLESGVFDELTALTELGLSHNQLTSLPSGVFDELTALTQLSLHHNQLTSLESGVFDELTALTWLNLDANELTSLPSGVFDELTALRLLYLRYNDLVDVSAVSGLTSLRELKVWENPISDYGPLRQLKIANRDIYIDIDIYNDPPVFPNGATTTRSIAENTASGKNIGAAVSARGSDTLTYSLGGPDAASFSIVSTSGQLQTKAALDYNTKSSYTVIVSVSDDNGGSDSITVTINVTNVNETIFTPVNQRTWQVQDAIVAAIEGVNSPDNVTVQHLATITTLNLWQKSIASLASSDFEGLTALTTLNLRDNDLTSLPYEVFNGLTALTTIDLRWNDFISLESGIFEGLTSLTTLDLSDSDLTSLPAGVFDGLTALTTLDLRYNDLTSLPAGVFDGLTALTTLKLNGSKLTSLESGVFDGLTALTTLYLHNNDLASLPAGIFDGLTALTTLYLSDNDLTSLPLGVFDELTALTKLNLRYNKLTSLESGVFDGLTALTTLDLFDNQLTSLSSGVFDELTALTTLDLSGNNELTSLSSGVFDGLTALITIDLSGNTGLTSLESGVFDGLTALTTIDLTYAPLPSLSSGVFDGLTSLETLILRHNRLTSVPSGVFDGLTSLETLILLGNGLKSLPSGIFDELTALKTLSLYNNQLPSLESGVFDELTALETLILHGNDLPSLPSGVFDQLTNLTELSLYDNQLTSLSSGVFDELTALTTLKLDSNKLTSLPSGVFDQLTALTELSLSYNDLDDVSAVSGLTSLTKLIVEENPISDYDPLNKLKAANPTIVIDISLNNSPPVFTDGDTTTRSVAENTAAGTNIGKPVTATDANIYHTLTYSLGGTDAESFAIVRTSGQLQTKAALDFETKDSYTVTVTVYDGFSGGDRITVTINVTDVAGAAPSVETAPLMPATTELLTNFPNPFNPETWIPYQLAKPAEVTLTLYDIRGVVVRRLQLGYQAAGFYQSRSRAIHWDGRNNIGEKVASGIYFYTLTAGEFTATQKLLIRK